MIILTSNAYFAYAGGNKTNLDNIANQAECFEKLSNGQLLKAILFGSGRTEIQSLVGEVKRRIASGVLNPQDNIAYPQGVTLLQALVCRKAQCSLSDIQDLVQSGADVNMPINGTLLHCAPLLEIAQYLIEQGVDCHALNADGSTALHMASIYGNQDLVQLLVDRKLDVNQQNNRGETPLYMVVATFTFGFFTDSAKCIQILLEHGARPDIADNQGKTPLSMAQEDAWFDKNIVKLLERYQSEIDSCANKNACHV